MRWIVREIWRAFPELDAYSDGVCREFMVRVQGGRRAKAVFTLVGAAAVLGAGSYIGITLIGSVARHVSASARSPTVADYAAVVVGAGMASGIVAIVWLRLRDQVLRWRLEYILRGTGRCAGCQQSLVGVRVPRDRVVHCPECGHAGRVHRSMEVLDVSVPTLDVLAAAPGGVAFIGSGGYVIEAPRMRLRHLLAYRSVRMAVWALLVVVGCLGCALSAIEISVLRQTRASELLRTSQERFKETLRTSRPEAELQAIVARHECIRPVLLAVEALASTTDWPREEGKGKGDRYHDPLRFEAEKGLPHVGTIRDGRAQFVADDDSRREDLAAKVFLGAFRRHDLSSLIVNCRSATGASRARSLLDEAFAGTVGDSLEPGRTDVTSLLAGTLLALGTTALQAGDFEEASQCVAALCTLAGRASEISHVDAPAAQVMFLNRARALIERAACTGADEPALARLESAWNPPSWDPTTLTLIMERCVANSARSAHAHFLSPEETRYLILEKWGVPEGLRYWSSKPDASVFGLIPAVSWPTPDASPDADPQSSAAAVAPPAPLSAAEVMAILQSKRRAFAAVLQELADGRASLPAEAPNWSLPELQDAPMDPRILAARLVRTRAEVEAILAVARWNVRHGAPPSAIADLVPEYLDAVPEEPCGQMRMVLIRPADSADPNGLGCVLEWRPFGEAGSQRAERAFPRENPVEVLVRGAAEPAGVGTASGAP